MSEKPKNNSRRGTKKCIKCGKNCGARTKICECGTVFEIKKNLKIKPQSKVKPSKKTSIGQSKRGIKICPKCKSKWPIRKKECLCSHVFYVNIKKKKRLKKVINVSLLKPDDEIVVSKNSGPYYLAENGERLKMGYWGRFTVKRLDKNGIVAYSPKIGWSYIYTGKSYFCNTTSIFKEPHKIYYAD